MENWEFIIQQEGDQEWLTLEPPLVEILEGRYRLMARSSSPHTCVEIQISHLFEENGLPKRRYQRRSQQSGSTGLVGVLPFTYLQPGFWRVSCRIQKLSAQGEPAATQQPSIQLQVLSKEPEFLSPWDDPESGLDAAVPEPDGLDISLATPTEPLAQFQPLAISTAPLVALDQSAYTAKPGEVVILSGQSYAQGTLAIALRDPRSQDLLWQHQLSLESERVPLSFSCPLELPAGRRVFVGEVRLILPGSSDGDGQQAQAFMITVTAANKDELPPEMVPVATVPSPLTVQESQPLAVSEPVLPSTPPDSLPPERKVKIPELPVFCQPLVNLPLRPCQGPTLPPKLYPSRTRRTAPQLPTIPDRKTVAAVQTRSGPTQFQVAARKLVATRSDRAAIAFESLQLSKRFWLTLNTLAREVELLPPPASAQKQDRINLPSGVEPDSTTPSPQLIDLAILHPIPNPELILPPVFVAGIPQVIKIQMADSFPSVCVKLWAADPLTESILAGPRWLVDFTYDPQQALLEAATALTLPGETESATFVAIAVDLNSRQESQKVILERAILPLSQRQTIISEEL